MDESTPPPSSDVDSAGEPKSKKTVWIALGVGGCLVLVIVVIAIVASLAFAVKEKTIRVTAASGAQNLKAGISAFFTEYRKYPSGVADSDVTVDSTDELMDWLIPTPGSPINPRQIQFFAAQPARLKAGKMVHGLDSSSNTLFDPWGNPFRARLDTDYDNVIDSPEFPGTSIATSILVWSAGPDGDFSTWEDNIKTW